MTSDGYWFLSKLVIRLTALLFVIYFFFNFGEFIAAYLIYSGIEWIPLSSTGGMLTSIGALTGLVLMDRAIDMLFEKVLSKNAEDEDSEEE